MKPEYQQSILVASPDKKIGKLLKEFFNKENINPILVYRSDKAIEELKKAENIFSVVIADQEIEHMPGTQVLDQIKSLSPDSTRVLMTSNFQIETIINAVNNGTIQNLIVKPWTEDDFVKAIKSGIKRYDLIIEDNNLLKTAKKQSKDLYRLDKKLIKKVNHFQKKIEKLDKKIASLQQEGREISSNINDDPENQSDKLMDEIENHVKSDAGIDPEKTETVFSNTIKILYDKFNETAFRSGFEMPDINGEIK